MGRCRWVYDEGVPGGKFLVPGCMNRAVHDDDADCHCPEDPETVEDRIEALRHELAEIRAPCPPRRKAMSDAGVYTARGIHELGQMVASLASEGFRIITVIDTQNGDYHVVAQKEERK